MKIQKEAFYIWLAFILFLAAVLAFFFKPLTDNFIAPTVLKILDVRESPESFSQFFSPDMAFLSLFAIIFLIVLRISMSPEPLIYLTYGSSLFFCFFYFFIGPIESILVLLAFFAPVFMWHQKKISSILLVAIGALLIVISGYYLHKPMVFILMLPMLHLFAIRANNSLQSRYSGNEVRVFSKLSTTQKSRINKNHGILKYDLWEVIAPELEALSESWAKVKEATIENSDMNELARPTSMPARAHLSSFLEIQDEKAMKKSMADLQKRDPNFSAENFLAKLKNAFHKIHMACYEHNIDPIQSMVSDALFEQFRCRIEEQKDAGIKFKCNDLIITDMRIARVNSDKNFDEIHVMLKAEAIEIATDTVSGETLNSEDKNQYISEFWSFIRKPSVKTLEKPGLMEGNCPNCGAPIEIGQATVCPICKSYIRSGNYDWVLSKVTQACEWEYANPRLVPGWNDLVAADANFTIHQIEDRCAVIFWMIRLVERKRKMEPMIRFATAKCCEGFKFALKGTGNYTYMENVSFASATLKAISTNQQCERLYLLVVWSGIPVKYTPEGRLPQVHRISKPKRDVLVFVRKTGQKTNQNNTLCSAHCPKCGGPMTSNFAINCTYCNTVLNDGSEWILEKVMSEQNQEYIDLISQKRQLIKQVVQQVKKEEAENIAIRSGTDLVSMATQMLLADGKIDDAEMALLKDFARRYEMPDEKLEGIIEAIKQGKLFIPQPENRKEAINLLEAAVAMAMADGEMAPEEQKYLDSLLKKFGYTKTDLTMVIRKLERRQLEEKKAEEIRLKKLDNSAKTL